MWASGDHHRARRPVCTHGWLGSDDRLTCYQDAHGASQGVPSYGIMKIVEAKGLCSMFAWHMRRQAHADDERQAYKLVLHACKLQQYG